MKPFKKFKQHWDSVKLETKEKIFFFLNYFLNAIPISVMVYVLMTLRYDHSIIRFIGTYIVVVVLLFYFEHYYIWLRSKWKED